MLIMFGARGVTTTPARGRFECPSCRASRAYALRRVRRFLVLFFLPVLPLRGEKTFVRCGFCRRAFPPSVLEAQRVVPLRGADAENAIDADNELLTGAAASTLLTWDQNG